MRYWEDHPVRVVLVIWALGSIAAFLFSLATIGAHEIGDVLNFTLLLGWAFGAIGAITVVLVAGIAHAVMLLVRRYS